MKFVSAATAFVIMNVAMAAPQFFPGPIPTAPGDSLLPEGSSFPIPFEHRQLPDPSGFPEPPFPEGSSFHIPFERRQSPDHLGLSKPPSPEGSSFPVPPVKRQFPEPPFPEGSSFPIPFERRQSLEPSHEPIALVAPPLGPSLSEDSSSRIPLANSLDAPVPSGSATPLTSNEGLSKLISVAFGG